MRIWIVVLVLLHSLVASRQVRGAAVDRYDSDRQQHTAVINFLDASDDRRPEEEEELTGEATMLEEEEDDEEYGDEYYYDGEDYDESTSGDDELEVPRVAMSSKPRDPSAILEAENTEGQRRRKGRKKGKGKGKKRNPCMKKYKDFCIHGTCQYLRDIRLPSCVCHPSFSGKRCELVSLPVEKPPEGYNRTTALAVVAVVLSSICLTIIGLLLMLRQRSGDTTSK
ncbi:heparin-binding EGF-like growth factor a isoform X2 [Dunckerocampus dactyliophorus]|uniref:heparin-binding EGF-like growth factor a isoform X2 n=1 Tax=Dunckerocampus dactyliophorus TaxID=161453 RepID=UPI00240619F0|nr:heparin-binding EGF-like growth factor a isoform X2 [Dunckerocampus dactyliophorus]